MTEENEKKLLEKYGHLCAPHMSRYGISCGDGWFTLINALFARIDNHIQYINQERERIKKHNKNVKLGIMPPYWKEGCAIPTKQKMPRKCPPVSVVQIKEKFGGLRYYYDGGDEAIENYVSFAEAMSEVTCEHCGSPGEVRSGGWLRCLCDKCHTQRTSAQDDDNAAD